MRTQFFSWGQAVLAFGTFLLASGLLRPVLAADPAPGTTRVAQWKDDKRSTFLIELDDSLPSHIQNAVPELQKRDLTATLYINPSTDHYKRNTVHWETNLPKIPGLVYGNHTMTHQGLKDYSSADEDLKQVNAVILKAFPGKEPRLLSFAKPGVSKEKWTISDEDYARVLKANNLVARELNTGLNAAVFNNLNTSEGMLKVVDDGISKGHMRAILFHGIGGDWLSVPTEVFTTFLDGLVARRDQLWITDHISAHQYEAERKAARVSVLEAKDGQIRLELRSEVTPLLYNLPLTLVTQVPRAWKYAQVLQGATKTVVSAWDGQVLFQAVPNGPEVVLTEVATGSPALAPAKNPLLATGQKPPASMASSQTASPAAVPAAAALISDAEAVAGWDNVTLINDGRVGGHAVRIAVPAGKAGGTGFNLRKANLDFSRGGTIAFWYRLTGTGETDLMFKLVTPTFAENFQAVFPVFSARKADGQWQQATLNLATYQKWGNAPETGSNYLYFRTNAPAGSNLSLDIDQVEYLPGQAPVTVPIAAPAPARRGPRLAPPSAERIQTIASYLDAVPRGIGFTIDKRGPFETLAADTPRRDALMKRAEKFLGEPIPVVDEAIYTASISSGARDINMAIDRRRLRLVHFVIAEGLENQGRFLPAIEKELLAICTESNWMIAAHVRFSGSNDLGSAMTAWTMASAVSLLGNHLSEQTRKTVQENVLRRVVRPYLAQMRNEEATADFWRYDPNNWNAVVHAGIVGSALCLLDSVQERAEIVAAAEKDTQNYIKGFPKDGYSTEGLGYWKYGFGHYVMLAEAVLAATRGRVNLFHEGSARQVAQFPRRFEIVPNVYPAYSDGPLKQDETPWLTHIMDKRYGLGDGAPRSYDLGGTFSTFLYAWSINLAFDPNSIQAPAPDSSIVRGHRIRDWFDFSQIYVGRPPVSGQGLSVSFKGGNNGTSHSHNDLGTYVVVAGNESLLLDPGSTVYNASTFGANRYLNTIINSYGHPVPRVAGQLQGQGSKYFATVASTSFSEARDSVTLDLTKGYQVPELTSLLRTYQYTRTGQSSLVITDRVAYSSPQAFGTALVTMGEAREEKPGVWIISQGTSAIRATIDAGGLPFAVTNEVLKDASAAGKVRRLGIDLNAPAAQATITVSVTPAS